MLFIFFCGDFGFNPRWRPAEMILRVSYEDSGEDVSLQDVNKSIDELSICDRYINIMIIDLYCSILFL